MSETCGSELEVRGLDQRGIETNGTQQLIAKGEALRAQFDSRVRAPESEQISSVMELCVEPFDPRESFELHRSVRASATAAARANGMELLFHSLPLSIPRGGFETTPKPRYLDFVHILRGRNAESWSSGDQAHFGTITDLDELVRITNGFGPWSHVLLALSASSPWWKGHDRGFASWRPRVFDGTPTVDSRDNFKSWDDYERATRQVLDLYGYDNSGDMQELSRVHDWVRPTRFGTVEVRVFDTCPSVVEPALWNLITYALGKRIHEEMHSLRSTLPKPWSSTLRKHAFVLAARDGIADKLVDPYTGRQAPALSVVAKLRAAVEGPIRDIGMWDEFSAVFDALVFRGNGAARLRNVRREVRETFGMTDSEQHVMTREEAAAVTARVIALGLHDDFTPEAKPRIEEESERLLAQFHSAAPSKTPASLKSAWWSEI